MTDLASLLTLAEELGFEHSGALDAATLVPLPEVRAMCAADKCHAYQTNWTCPPQCGTLEECTERIGAYSCGILVQSVGELEDSFDFEGMMELEENHKNRFLALVEQVRAQYPDALCLGTGGCRACKKCAYPEPCRFPKKAFSSMEAYGLQVSDVCKANNMKYYYGAGTLAYTACVLLK